MWSDDGGEDTRQEIHVQIEVGHESLDMVIPALFIFLTEDDWQICEVWIFGSAIREILVADEVEDEVSLGHDDATESEAEWEEGRKEPEYLNQEYHISQGVWDSGTRECPTEGLLYQG